jgi:hypothetical protein
MEETPMIRPAPKMNVDRSLWTPEERALRSSKKMFDAAAEIVNLSFEPEQVSLILQYYFDSTK